VLRTYSRPRESMPIVQVMVPRAMALEAAYCASVVEEDEDTSRGLCRLFTEMGESYLEMLLWGEVRFANTSTSTTVQLIELALAVLETVVAAVGNCSWASLSYDFLSC
jgi:hypothetical protein